jgi:energy-coupling factor transporter ATP-binding protein EcfA2
MIDPPPPLPEKQPKAPASIRTRMDFRTALNAVHDQSGLSLREVCRAIEISPQALHGYLSGKNLPRSTGRNIAPFIELLRVGYGITDDAELDAWTSALRRVTAQPGPRPDDETNPYPGLRPFHEEDSAWYFGREDLTAEAVKCFRTASVSDNRSMIVTGPSGVGKSALINAGIRATIHSAEEFSRWSVHPVVIGTEPVAALDAALAPSPHDPQVLVVDQLETLWNETVDAEQRQEFLRRIAALTSGDQSPPVFVLMGLRGLLRPGSPRPVPDANRPREPGRRRRTGRRSAAVGHRQTRPGRTRRRRGRTRRAAARHLAARHPFQHPRHRPGPGLRDRPGRGGVV